MLCWEMYHPKLVSHARNDPAAAAECTGGGVGGAAAINLEAAGSKQLRFVHLTPAQGIVTARLFTQGDQLRVTVTADLDVPLVRIASGTGWVHQRGLTTTRTLRQPTLTWWILSRQQVMHWGTVVRTARWEEEAAAAAGAAVASSWVAPAQVNPSPLSLSKHRFGEWAALAARASTPLACCCSVRHRVAMRPSPPSAYGRYRTARGP